MRLLLPLGLAIAAAGVFFARFHGGSGMLAFYDDDFFYYLRIAQHIAAGHHSTFDGTHLTNGYHPLWMLVISALVWLFGSGSAFFYALQSVLLLCVLVTYFFIARTLAGVAPRTGWAPQWIAAGLATSAITLAAGGMEVALAIPLVSALVYYRLCVFSWRPWRAFLLGVLSAAAVLARLDLALLAVTMAVLDVSLHAEVSVVRRLQCSLAYLCGASPVGVYLVLNKRWFGTPMPVSGQAKEMRFHHWPSSSLLHFFFSPPQLYFMVYPLLLAIIAAIIALVAWHPVWQAALRGRIACVVALLVFPFLFLATLSMLSDWHLWAWYGYPLVVAGIGAATVLLASAGGLPAKALGFSIKVRWTAWALLLLAWIAFGVSQWENATRSDKVGYSLYLEAVDIARFGNTHPGIYAMGDRAGTPGYLLHWPLVQLEGLVMDKAFLANIREQRPLVDVLRNYGVRYYIATNLHRLPNGCWAASEPYMAGPDAPRMRGMLCVEPLAEFQHSGFDTMIFGLVHDGGRPQASM
jgi:hypothetical protein